MAPTTEHEAQPGVLRKDEALVLRMMARVFNVNVSAPGPARVTVLSTDRAEFESCRDADVLDSCGPCGHRRQGRRPIRITRALARPRRRRPASLMRR